MASNTCYLYAVITKKKRFLWKSQFGVRRCATEYGMFYACTSSLDLFIPYRKIIQSPAVTRCRIPGILCHQIQNRRHWPHTWWLIGNSFSLSADLLIRKIQVIGFLKSGNNVIAIFTKSTWYCPCVNQIILDWSGIKTCLQRAKKLDMERRNSRGSDKVIPVYPINPAL